MAAMEVVHYGDPILRKKCSPVTDLEKIEELKSELNLQNLQVWSNFPGVKHKDAMRSIKLFTEKVMPHFKNKLNTGIKKVSWKIYQK